MLSGPKTCSKSRDGGERDHLAAGRGTKKLLEARGRRAARSGTVSMTTQYSFVGV